VTRVCATTADTFIGPLPLAAYGTSFAAAASGTRRRTWGNDDKNVGRPAVTGRGRGHTLLHVDRVIEGTAPAPVQPRRRVSGPVVAGVLIAALGLGIAIGVIALKVRQHDNAAFIRPTGIPSVVPTKTADLMQLSPVPHVAASNFTLTDQAGHSMSMASLHGKVVVMEFMDPHCTDICPIVSQEFIEAYRDLSPAARSRVVFLAVNVNEYHTKVSEMAAFTNEQHLNTVPTWHFLTGAVPELKSIWHAYGIEVEAPSPNADVIHSSFMFFIDPQGKERYLADPMVDHTKSGASYLPLSQQTAWGRGIAMMANQLAR
jgi:cytochrome oxidase Cu insertion factor (SCO1/SenC/PrrC family)